MAPVIANDLSRSAQLITTSWFQREVRSYANALVVTQNFRHYCRSESGQAVKCDPDIARVEIKRFFDAVDKAVYGRNAVRRFNRRLRRIPVLEHGHDRGWHVHTVIEPPANMELSAFVDLIKKIWSDCQWSSGPPDFQVVFDDGIAGYLTKKRSKSMFEAWTDAIIVEAMVMDTKYVTSHMPRNPSDA